MCACCGTQCEQFVQSVNSNSTTLGGTAWLNVRRIVIDGRPEPLQFNWTTLTNWQVVVPLILGTNRLNFLAYDFQGNLLASAAITVTSTKAGGGLDNDGDGMPDVWEEAVGLSPFIDDADADADGDGLSNLQEYLAGTLPLDPSSCLKVNATSSGNGVRLTFHAVAGRSYTIEYRDALGAGQWSRLTNIAAQAADHAVAIPDALSAGAGGRFYRLATPQVP